VGAATDADAPKQIEIDRYERVGNFLSLLESQALKDLTDSPRRV
jgi:hypothetical protein